MQASIHTTAPTRLIFKDGSFKVGYFDYTSKSDDLVKKNKYTFIEFKNAQKYRSTGDVKYATVINGDDLVEVIYPYRPERINEDLLRFDPSRFMQMAIDEMKRSINEPRDDGKVSPKVGAVLVKHDGSVETAFRGEIRLGDQ